MAGLPARAGGREVVGVAVTLLPGAVGKALGGSPLGAAPLLGRIVVLVVRARKPPWHSGMVGSGMVDGSDALGWGRPSCGDPGEAAPLAASSSAEGVESTQVD